jgi:hypothetical protein
VMRLGEVSYRTGKMAYRSRHSSEPEWALPGYLEEAKAIFTRATTDLRALSIVDPVRTDDFEELRWFPLPSEVVEELRGCELLIGNSVARR